MFQTSRVGFFATAFTTGAVVMALEILGSRLLAPVFGSSLFVWGALIGVILAAMSSGYATGGWLADRHPAGLVLAGLLLISGGWTMFLAWMGQPVVFTVARWFEDPRWGPCLAAAVLLAFPAFGLSGVLPSLLRLAIADMGHLGWHTGGMIAISTVGSLVGTWGTAFYLLTWLGSLTLVAVLGVVQVGLGLIWWWWAGHMRVRLLLPVVGGFGLLAWAAFHPVLVQPPAEFEEESPYQQVRVQDNDLFRFLILDNTFHAVMWRVDPVYLALPYSEMMMAPLAFPRQFERGLILGHGGGSLAKWLGEHWPEMKLDVVEMDPSVVKVAEEYFDYKVREGHRVFVADARAFLRTGAEQYDIIWLDVFARHLIPFHLTTREFFAELRAHLTSHGILAVNLASSGSEPDQMRARAIVTTMRTSFPTIESFSVQGPRWMATRPGSANLVFFAGPRVSDMRTESFVEKMQALIQRGRLPAGILDLMNVSEMHLSSPGIILTDDYSPFDILQGSG